MPQRNSVAVFFSVFLALCQVGKFHLKHFWRYVKSVNFPRGENPLGKAEGPSKRSTRTRRVRPPKVHNSAGAAVPKVQRYVKSVNKPLCNNHIRWACTKDINTV